MKLLSLLCLFLLSFDLLADNAKSPGLNPTFDYEISLQLNKLETKADVKYHNSYFEIFLCPKNAGVEIATLIDSAALQKLREDCAVYKKSSQDRNFYRLARYWRGSGDVNTFFATRAQDDNTASKISKIKLIDLFKARHQKNLALDQLSILIVFTLEHLQPSGLEVTVPHLLTMEKKLSSNGKYYYSIFEEENYRTKTDDNGNDSFESIDCCHDFTLGHFVPVKKYQSQHYLIPWNPLDIGLDPRGKYSQVLVSETALKSNDNHFLKNLSIQQNIKQVLPDEAAQKYYSFPQELLSPFVAASLMRKEVDSLRIADILALQNLSNNPDFSSYEVFKAVREKRLSFSKTELDAFWNATKGYAESSPQTLLLDYANFYARVALSVKLEAEGKAQQMKQSIDTAKEQNSAYVETKGSSINYTEALARYRLFKEQSADAAEAIHSIRSAFVGEFNRVIR